MKFGRLLQDFNAGGPDPKRSRTDGEQSASFLDYKSMKKTLKKASEAKEAGDLPLSKQLEKEFVDQLHADLEEINISFIEQEEEAIIKMQTLRDDYEASRRKRSAAGGDNAGDADIADNPDNPDNADNVDNADNADNTEAWLASPAVRSIRSRFVDLHGELVLLLHWSIMNYAGTLKILKKHDKLLGGHTQQDLLGTILRMPFTSTASVARLASDAEGFVQKLGGERASMLKEQKDRSATTGSSPTVSSQLAQANSLRELMDEAEKWAQEKDSGNAALLEKTRAALAMLNELQTSAHTPSTLNLHGEIKAAAEKAARSISA